jgi:predicted dehydrogenase
MLTRRTFLKTSALAAAGTAISAKSWSQVSGANGTIRVAVAGLNSRGAYLVREFNEVPGVRVVALCDVDTAVLAKASRDFSITDTTGEFRDLLSRPDIDVVAIATPNHWHALQTIWACQAGKDVYVEKPVSHTIWEGRQEIAAIAKYGRIASAGNQARSAPCIAEAVAWVRAGNLGSIKVARGFCYKRRASIGLTVGPQPIPPTVNYDLWVGPAPFGPLRRKHLHYDWHWVFATGNGDIGNQGLHQMDVARWFLGEKLIAPHSLAVAGRLGYHDDGETPNTVTVVHDYPAAPLVFEVRGLPSRTGTEKMDAYRGIGVGNVIECEDGYVCVPATYTTATAYDNSGRVVREFRGGGSQEANFIEAVRARDGSLLHAPVADSHISSSLSHVSNISFRLGQAQSPAEILERIQGEPGMTEAAGRMFEHLAANGVDFSDTPIRLGVPLRIDPEPQRFVGNDEANALLTQDYRAPYVVPETV